MYVYTILFKQFSILHILWNFSRFWFGFFFSSFLMLSSYCTSFHTSNKFIIFIQQQKNFCDIVSLMYNIFLWKKKNETDWNNPQMRIGFLFYIIYILWYKMNIGSDKNKILYIIFNWDYVRQHKIISHTIVITLKIYIDIIFLTTQRKKAYWIYIFDFYHYKAPLNVKYVASKNWLS